jgi:soluble lytic murein transglycosylase-like protein
MPQDPNLIALACVSAERHGLQPALVCAVIEQESSWNCYAMRFEPAFQMRYVRPLTLSPTEETARSISWGLMQVMGQVAREQGFEGLSLAALCEPAIGLEVGCAVLSGKLTAGGEDISKGLLLWNGGGDPLYGRKVLAKLNSYEYLNL